MSAKLIEYVAEPTPARFHASDAFVRGLMGPIGSGKSVACCIEIMSRALRQAPSPDKVRRSRWVIVRNTYRELEDTTRKTWHDWFPEAMGRWIAGDLTHLIDSPLPDGTRLHLEVLFRALDRPQDIKKLLSLELTGAWLNEAREIPREVFDMVQGRVGRYPSKREGGASWFGVIADTNPPDDDHWWYTIFEELRPEEFELYKQPAGDSAEAENLDNLPERYYQRASQGKNDDWIQVYVKGRYGFVKEGKPVWQEYNDALHCAAEPIPWDKSLELYVGLDFGLTPAAAIAQRAGDGQYQVIREVVTEYMGTTKFAQELRRVLGTEFKGAKIAAITGDPAGGKGSMQHDEEETVFSVLEAEGIIAEPADTNEFTIRRDAVGNLLTRLTVTGRPALILSPRCKTLRKALAGGYAYKRVQISGEKRFKDQPDKNRYSHVADALQYLALGAGEGEAVVRGNDPWAKIGNIRPPANVA